MSTTLEQFRLDGRTIIVTGAAGLLGKVFVAALLEGGARVVMVDLPGARLEAGHRELAKSHPDTVMAAPCDITDEAQVGALIARLAPIHALVNSAAVDPKFEPGPDGTFADDGRFTTYSLANWKRSLDVNLTGTFLMTRAVCADMESRDEGAIVNIASTYGLTGPDQRIYERQDGRPRFYKPVDYSTTKSGILGFTRAVAAFYRGTRIRVNALTPGGAYNGHDETFEQAYSARTVLGRMAEPDEYRAALLFLCSDASSYMTGSNLVVDGGWTTL